MINTLIELTPKELESISGGINKKQIAWRMFQIMLVGGYLSYEVYLAAAKAKVAVDRHDKNS